MQILNLIPEKNLLFIIFVLILGIFLLIKGADWLIENASDLAKRLKISDLLIGLLIVSVGTSLPELIVSLFANSSQNGSEIAISNILGSNIANVLLVLGLSTLFSSSFIKVPRNLLKREIPLSFLLTVLLWILIYFDQGFRPGLSFIDGLLLSSGFLAFIILSFYSQKKVKINNSEIKNKSLSQLILFLILGATLLNLGGKLTIDSSIKLADYFKLSKTLIGLTVLAVGTSLPELVTTIISGLKNKNEMALGNIIGSNIFNILFVLGVSSLFNFVEFSSTSYPDLYMAGLTSLILMSFILVFNKKRALGKIHGALFLTIYFSFLAYRIFKLQAIN